MLKTSGSTKSTIRPRKSRVGIGGYGNETLTLRVKTSSLTNSSTSAAQIVIKFDGVDAGGGGVGKSIKKLSKSLKNFKSLKSCKGHWFGGMFTKAPILHQLNTKNSSFC